MLTERFRPLKIEEIIGNEQARLEIVKWLKGWKIGSKPLMLTGPPGVGKSTLVYAVARKFGYTVIEYNASDTRTRDKLRSSVGPLLQNASVFSGQEKLLVFLDEIDGLSGRSDYAGMDFILDFIENSTLPLALAANVEEDPKLKKIEQKSKVIRFKPVTEDVLFIYLRHIAEKEEIDAPSQILKEIAERSRGDVRYALNLLQTLVGWRSPTEEKDRQFLKDSDALYEILNAPSMEKAIQGLRQLDAQPRDKVRYFFDTVAAAKNLSIEEKAEALDKIAKADLLLGEITQKQSWRLLRYVDRFLADSVLSKNLKFSDSSIPWNLKLSIWNDGRVIKGMGEQLSEKFHVSKSTLASFYLPYIARYFKDRPDLLSRFLEENNLGDSEQRVILKISRT